MRTGPPKARFFGDLTNPSSEVNRLIGDKHGVRLLDHTGNRPEISLVTRHFVDSPWFHVQTSACPARTPAEARSGRILSNAS